MSNDRLLGYKFFFYLFASATKYLSPCSVPTLQHLYKEVLVKDTEWFPDSAYSNVHTATHVSIKALLATKQSSGISTVHTHPPAFSLCMLFS